MIIISARFDTEPGSVEKLTDALVTMMQASEAEEGCFTYAFSTEVGDATKLRIFERWQDEASLKAHFKTPHMAVFQAVLADNPPKSVAVQVFDVTGEIPMPDVS